MAGVENVLCMWQTFGIKKMYVNSQACVRVKGGDSKCFRIESGVRKVLSCPLGSSMCIWMQ